MTHPPPGRELPAPTGETQLLAWLLEVLHPMNRTRVKQVLRSGQVIVNGQPATRHDHPLTPGDRIHLTREPRTGKVPDELGGIRIIHHDEAILVIDKPSGLLTVATESEKLDTAFVRLKLYLARTRGGHPFVVHRLDRDTSGLLLFARSVKARDALQAGWDQVVKKYLAVTEGVPGSSEGVIESYLLEGRDLKVRSYEHPRPEAKRAVSRYRVLQSRGRYALVEVTLETGRKHQIRVHMSELGCPVAGDAVYGAASNPAGRLGLHAWRLAFDHPRTGQRIELESLLPEKIRGVIGVSPADE
jgi:23S rRNA pseudouridine1911/1915/1917 synthase